MSNNPLIEVARNVGLFYRELRKQGVGRHLSAEMSLKILAHIIDESKKGVHNK